jgi:hypothetical protein
MRRNYLFWGSVLILLSVLFLLKALGITNDIWGYFWLLAVGLLGVWFIVWAIWRPKGEEGEQVAIELKGAQQASLHLNHGAGRLRIGAGVGEGTLLSGKFGYGLDYKTEMVGDKLEVRMRSASNFGPFIGEGFNWNLNLTRDIPISLTINTGASESRIDLSELRVPYLKLETGASSTTLTLPAQAGNTLAEINAGVASVDIHVPEGVAARIRIKEGLSARSINSARFSRLEGNIYQSPDYDQAANRVELNIEAGIGSISIQ